MFNLFIYLVLAWCCLYASNIQALTINDRNIQLRQSLLADHHQPGSSREFSLLFNEPEHPVKETDTLTSFDNLFQSEGHLQNILAAATSDVPTSQPTSYPTINPQDNTKILFFNAVIKLVHVDGSHFTQQSFDSVRDVILSIWPIKLSQIGSPKVISYARKLLESKQEAPVDQMFADFEEDASPVALPEPRRQLSNTPYNSTFIISYPVSFPLVDYPKFRGNATALYISLTNIMDDFVFTQQFQALLIEVAKTNNATQLYEVIVPIIHYYDYYVANKTFSPTVLPTSMPSSSPTSFPTSMPTPHPTPVPSPAPTSTPTVAPTKNYANTFLQFSVFFGVNNVTSQTLSLGGEQSVLETITDITDVPTDQMVYKGITNEVQEGPSPSLSPVSAPAAAPTAGGRRLSENWDMVIEVQLTVPLSDFPQYRGHPDKLFAYLKGLFLSSVYDPPVKPAEFPLFTEHLRKNALLWGNELDWAEVVKTDFNNWILVKDYKQAYEPTSQPTGRPTSSPTISDAPDSLEFNAYWGFDQTTTTTLSIDGQTSLVQTMIDVMDVSLNNVQYVAVTDSLRRKLVNIKGSHQMVVQTKITVPFSEFPEFDGNATKIYLYLTHLLTNSVFGDQNSFQILLRSNAVKNNAVEIENVVVFDVRFEPFRLVRHTKAPTFLPTFAPTSNNNGGGSGDNTDAPTLHPTAAPNGGGGGGNNPTYAPTSNNGGGNTPTYSPTSNNNNGGGGDSTPTFSPTAFSSSSGTSQGTSDSTSQSSSLSTAQGTSQDTSNGSNAPVASPTAAPTFQVTSNAVLQYKAIFVIQNLTAATFSVPEQNALLQSIAENNNIQLSTVEYLGIRKIVSGRRLTVNDELYIATRLTYSLKDHPDYLNATLLYLDSTAQLRNAVNSHAFTKLFRLNSDDNGATDSLQGTVVRVDFEDAQTTTPVVNSNGNAQINFSSADLAAIVSSTIVGFGMILFLFYVGYVRCYSKGSKRTETYDEDHSQSNSQSQDDSMDFHTIYDGNNEWTDDVMIFINIQEDENASASSTISSRVMMPQTIVSSDGTFESRM